MILITRHSPPPPLLVNQSPLLLILGQIFYPNIAKLNMHTVKNWEFFLSLIRKCASAKSCVKKGFLIYEEIREIIFSYICRPLVVYHGFASDSFQIFLFLTVHSYVSKKDAGTTCTSLRVVYRKI
jgi:hypothetical protein